MSVFIKRSGEAPVIGLKIDLSVSEKFVINILLNACMLGGLGHFIKSIPSVAQKTSHHVESLSLQVWGKPEILTRKLKTTQKTVCYMHSDRRSQRPSNSDERCPLCSAPQPHTFKSHQAPRTFLLYLMFCFGCNSWNWSFRSLSFYWARQFSPLLTKDSRKTLKLNYERACAISSSIKPTMKSVFSCPYLVRHKRSNWGCVSVCCSINLLFNPDGLGSTMGEMICWT